MTGRRADGFHDLDTLVVFARVGDRLEAESAGGLSLTLDGPFAHHAPEDESNLVLRAAAALSDLAATKRAHRIEAAATRSPLPHKGGEGRSSMSRSEPLNRKPVNSYGAHIHLTKHLPAGAGLGGGSSDAAAALLLLSDLWELSAGEDTLAQLGARLGADVPMCLIGRALRARGTGERIERIEGWPALPLVLAWPGAIVPTASVFAALTARANPPLPAPTPRPATPAGVADYLRYCRNDLETPAILVAPVIGEALEALRAQPGCLLARMTGSGSACFGLHAGEREARAAAASLRAARPDWWVTSALAG